MAGEGFLVDYQAKMEERIKEVESFLGSGKCKSYDEYRHNTGKIKGMRRAIDDMKDILQKYQTDEGEVFDESVSE